MAEQFQFKYKAEEIEHKLDLIDKNKNLIPYPYTNTLPNGLINVGDGSILTTGDATSSAEFFLKDCTLAAGTYISSLEVTDLTNPEHTVTNPGFNLKVKIDNAIQNATFTIDKAKSATIYLVVPAGCTTKNLLIKPQLEEGSVKTTWVPNMDKIGTYVDRRFNGTNIKIRALNDALYSFLDCIEITEAE